MKRVCLLLLGMTVAWNTGCNRPKGYSSTDRREYVQNMKQTTLEDFYAKNSDLRHKVDESVGYGVFSNVGFTVIFVGAGDGYGVVVDKASGKETYMRMVRGSAGLGLGVKDFRALLVFHSQDALDEFVNHGWQFSGEGEAAAKASDKGGAAGVSGDVARKVEMYELTKNGLSASATLGGAKFWRDKDLN